jgi:four helix bundle protein
MAGFAVRDHRRLRAFALADGLALAVYSTTRTFPQDERFGLVSQLRRAAVSVASNIVEGCGRSTEADFLRFLDIANGSAREVAYQLSLARRLGFLELEAAQEIETQAAETAQTLAALVRAVRRKL